MPYMRVIRKTTSVETLYVYADDAERAKAEVSYGNFPKECLIDRKVDSEITCEGEWGDEPEWTVLFLGDGQMRSTVVAAPSEAIARDRVEVWHWKKFDIVAVYPGRIVSEEPANV